MNSRALKASPRSGYSLAGAAVLALLLLSLGVGGLARSFNHDEGQFVASGALLAREGLLPYVDYPYFHLPNLVFIYAALFSTNGFLLLTARAFNLICAWLLLVLVYAITASAFRFLGQKRWLVAAAAALLLALNPLFRFTVGRAWNHDLPVLASVAAIACLLCPIESARAGRWRVVSGVLIGLASGTRLTFLPLLAPFLFFSFFYAPTKAQRWRGAVCFLAGFSLALLPTIALLAAAPTRFLFDNLAYNGPINLRFRASTRPAAITLGNRLLFPIRIIGTSPSNLLLVAGFGLFACWLPLRQGWRNLLQHRAAAVLLLLLPFAVLGAVIPSPPYRQYYYAIMPFLLLGTVLGLARIWSDPRDHRKIFGLLSALLAISFLEFLPSLQDAAVLTRPRRWPVWSLHQKGREIQAATGAARVLTLAPVAPLEGGSRIYKEFCTGSFAWRVAPFMEENDKLRYDMIDAPDLDAFLKEKPAAILTGSENHLLEEPLVAYAQRNAYVKVELKAGGILWLRVP